MLPRQTDQLDSQWPLLRKTPKILNMISEKVKKYENYKYYGSVTMN